MTIRPQHIRSPHQELADALTAGVHASPTLRALVRLLESSDVVVYVVFEPPRTASVAAHVSFITAAGGRRYLHVGIDPKYAGVQLLGLLGHELQHAVEIAAEPAVLDDRSLSALYRRIGFRSRPGTVDHFDSDAAIDAGDRVMREAHATRGAHADVTSSSSSSATTEASASTTRPAPASSAASAFSTKGDTAVAAATTIAGDETGPCRESH